MSFFEKAKQAATEMAAKADQAMANAGISGPGLGTGAAGPGGPGGQAGGGREAEAALRDMPFLRGSYAAALARAEAAEAKLAAMQTAACPHCGKPLAGQKLAPF